MGELELEGKKRSGEPCKESQGVCRHKLCCCEAKYQYGYNRVVLRLEWDKSVC